MQDEDGDEEGRISNALQASAGGRPGFCSCPGEDLLSSRKYVGAEASSETGIKRGAGVNCVVRLFH